MRRPPPGTARIAPGTLGLVTGVGDALSAGLDGLLVATDQRPEVLAAGLFALVMVVWTPAWRLTGGIVTIAHEGGHAVVAVLTGRGLSGIRLHADGSGSTFHVGRDGGIGLVLTAFGGYPAPALFGLVGATLVSTDRAAASLWLVVVLLVATLVHVRNVFGTASVLLTGAAVVGVAWWGQPVLQAAFAAALSWFLLFGGLRSVRDLQRTRRHRFDDGNDADALAGLTGIPGGVWAGLFWLLGAAAVATGAWLLVLGPLPG
jgi:Peptidase M50B-like